MSVVQNMYNELQKLVNDAAPDVQKVVSGNKAARTRLRKTLMASKKLSHELRKVVMDEVAPVAPVAEPVAPVEPVAPATPA